MARGRGMTLRGGRLLAVGALLVVGCSSTADPSPDDRATPLGLPCAPRAELSWEFNDFDDRTATLEALSTPLRSGDLVCLVYHFRGRTTCPYGQAADGHAPLGSTPCTTGSGDPVYGGDPDPSRGREVRAQCIDRRPADTVLWSCRCANEAGRVDDGDTYCKCPLTTTCQPIPGLLGAEAMPGAYCVKSGTEYDPRTACSVTCDPATQPCP